MIDKEIIQKFEEKFAQIIHLHRGECVITDVTGTKFEAHTDDYGKVTEIGGLKSIKDFLKQALKQAREDERAKYIKRNKETVKEFGLNELISAGLKVEKIKEIDSLLKQIKQLL